MRTTVVLAADDGYANGAVPTGTVVTIHELPCDNAGLYSVSLGLNVYDVEVGEVEHLQPCGRTCADGGTGQGAKGNLPEDAGGETSWLRGVQIWLESRLFSDGSLGASASAPAAAAALQLFKQALSVSSRVPLGMLAQRALFCAVSLRGVGDAKASLEHFEAAIALKMRQAEGEESEKARTEFLEAVFREFADALEGLGLVEQARRLASRAVSCGVLWTSQWQRPNFMLRGMEARPFWALTEGWVPDLEKGAQVIREELLALLRATDLWRSEARPHALAHGAWRERVLFGKGGRRELAPRTSAMVAALLPEAVDLCDRGAGEVLFSALGPRTAVAPHCAPHNLRLTAHLGLVVPPRAAGRCALRVQEEWREWHEGRVLIFDDSFEHEVVNDTDQMRVVLLLRFWHPALAQDPRQQAEALEELRLQAESAMRFKAMPPVGSQELQLRLMNMRPCSVCGRDEALAINFVWGEQPNLTATCTCGSVLTSCSTEDSCTNSESARLESAVQLTELD